MQATLESLDLEINYYNWFQGLLSAKLYFLTSPILNSEEYTEASSMLTLFMSSILSGIHLDCTWTNVKSL